MASAHGYSLKINLPMKKAFFKVGHWPTLFCAFLYFDISFMVWVILGPLGIEIAKTLGLDAAQKGLMVATPVLAGAVLRVVNGILVDHIGPKRAGLFAQLFVIAGLSFMWWHGIHSFAEVLVVGIFLGMAGASFAVALPLASRWYPPQHQGTALGIAGAGNSGTVLASLFAPSLAVAFGWSNVIGLAVDPAGRRSRRLYRFSRRTVPISPAPKTPVGLFRCVEGRRRLVVHAVLRRHLRRLRRPRLVAAHLFQ